MKILIAIAGTALLLAGCEQIGYLVDLAKYTSDEFEECSLTTYGGRCDLTAIMHQNKAIWRQKEDDLYEALRQINISIQIDPTSAKSHNIKGHVLRDLGDWNAAMKSHEQSLSLDDKYWRAYLGKANVLYYSRKDYPAAIENFNLALDNLPLPAKLSADGVNTLGSLYGLLGLAHGKEGNNKAKCMYIQKAIEQEARHDKLLGYESSDSTLSDFYLKYCDNKQ